MQKRNVFQLVTILALSIYITGCATRSVSDQVTDAKVAYGQLTGGILSANDVGLVPENIKPIIKAIDQEAYTALKQADADVKSASTQPSKTESASFYLKQFRGALARFQTYLEKFQADKIKRE